MPRHDLDATVESRVHCVHGKGAWSPRGALTATGGAFLESGGTKYPPQSRNVLGPTKEYPIYVITSCTRLNQYQKVEDKILVRLAIRHLICVGFLAIIPQSRKRRPPERTKPVDARACRRRKLVLRGYDRHRIPTYLPTFPMRGKGSFRLCSFMHRYKNPK